MRTDAPRRQTLILALGLGLTLLAGCAVNKGTALADAFAEEWEGTPDVARIDTTHDNTLPFAGHAYGTLVVEDGTSSDRVVELAGELSVYAADHDEITGRIEADGITFTAAAGEERVETIVAVWQTLAEDDRVAVGDINANRSEDQWEVHVTAIDTDSALAVFKDLVADGDAYQPFPWAVETALKVWTDADDPRSAATLAIDTDDNGAVPAAAIAAYEAVADQYEVLGGHLGTGSARIVVTGAADLAHAAELARTAAPSLGAAIEVVIDDGV